MKPAATEESSKTPTPSPRRHGRLTGNGKKFALKSAAATVALGSVATLAAAQPAAANTPSDSSHTFYVGGMPGVQGLPVTVGWTKDHAWVISSYGAAISAGSGLIASQLCSLTSGETGPLNPVGKACSTAVTAAVTSMVQGHPALTNHGLWIAYYPWGGQRTSGTW